MSKKILSIMSAILVVAGLTAALPAFAEVSATSQANINVNVPGVGGMMGNRNANRAGENRGNGMMMRPVIVGSVSSISGNTLTVAGKQDFKSTTATTTYTVDATNAKVYKNNATSSVSSIAVSDMVAVQGTLTGTNVVATSIRDGFAMRGPGKDGTHQASTSPIVMGNGQPVVAGTISSISGNTISITTKSNVTYTVDTTNAKFVQGNSNVSLSNFAVGNSIVVQGTVNGTNVAASTVLDQSKPANTSSGNQNDHPGFFRGIGQFFMHLFGF